MLEVLFNHFRAADTADSRLPATHRPLGLHRLCIRGGGLGRPRQARTRQDDGQNRVGGVDVSEGLCNLASDLKIMGARVTLTRVFEIRPPSKNAKEPKTHTSA